MLPVAPLSRKNQKIELLVSIPLIYCINISIFKDNFA